MYRNVTMRTNLLISAAALIAALSIVTACSGRRDGQTASTVDATEGLSDKGDTSQPLFWVDGQPVGASAYQRFVAENVAGGSYHQGKISVKDGGDDLKYLDSFLVHRATLEEARRLGLASDPFLKNAVRTGYLSLLGRSYFQHLVETAVVDPGELQARLPVQWVQMRFRLKLFKDLGSAEDAGRQIKNEEDFNVYDSQFTFGNRGQDTSTTDWLSRNSGFFDDFDDPYLFSLKQGEISRPVATGLGAAIAYVQDRHDFTPEEQERYLAEVRRDLSVQWALKKLGELEAGTGLVVDESALQQSIKEELLGYPNAERTVMMVGDHSVSYREFRYLAVVNINDLARMYPVSSLGKLLSQDVRNLGQNIVLGLESGKQGYKPASPEDLDTPWRRFVRKVEYDQAQRLLVASMEVPVPGEQELAAFYRENPGSFLKKGGIRFAYYFTPQRKDVEMALKQYRDGLDFKRLKFRPADSGHAGDVTYKEAFSRKGDALFKDIRPKLKMLSAGQAAIVDGGMGSYLVRIIEIVPDATIGFDIIKAEIRDRIVNERRERAATKFLRKAVGGYNVDFNDPARPDKTAPPIRHPETG